MLWLCASDSIVWDGNRPGRRKWKIKRDQRRGINKLRGMKTKKGSRQERAKKVKREQLSNFCQISYANDLCAMMERPQCDREIIYKGSATLTL